VLVLVLVLVLVSFSVRRAWRESASAHPAVVSDRGPDRRGSCSSCEKDVAVVIRHDGVLGGFADVVWWDEDGATPRPRMRDGVHLCSASSNHW